MARTSHLSDRAAQSGARTEPATASKGWLSDFAWVNGAIVVRKTGVRVRIDADLIAEVVAWAVWLAVLGVVVLGNRLRAGPRIALWYAPDQPRPWYLLRGAALWAGFKTAPSLAEADAAFYFDDTTRGAAPEADGLRCFNAGCTDVSKSHVAAVFEEVFGYPLALDPTTAAGRIVEKAEKNGVHDGRVVIAPLSPRDGYVYQRLIDTTDDAGFGYDLRTPCVGGAPTVVWIKTKPEGRRFEIHNSKAVLHNPAEVYSVAELDQIARFTARMGLDWGGLDILRDRHDGRIYIVDVNKTDLGPVIALSWADKVRSMARLSKALAAMVGAATPARADANAAAPGYARWTAPAGLMAAGLLLMVFWASRDPRQSLIDAFRHYAATWRTYDNAHPWLAMALYVGAYAGAIVTMLPVALVMTFCSGAIFGAVGGAAGSVLGAVLGAAIAYGLGASSGAPGLSGRGAGRWLEGLRAYPFRYTLSLRLMPLTPFTLVSVAAGIGRIGKAPFLAGTVLGVLPECVIYSAIGAGLTGALEQGANISLSSFLHPVLLLGLAGLAILALASAHLGRADREPSPSPSQSMESKPATR